MLPDANGFAAELEKQVRVQVKNAKIPAVKVRDVQVLREFKTELQRKVNAAVAQVRVRPINVPVNVVGGGRAAATGAERAAREVAPVARPTAPTPPTVTGATKEAAAIQQGKRAQDQATESTKRRTIAERELEAVLKRVEVAQLRLTNIQNIGLGARSEQVRLSQQLTSLGRQQTTATELVARAEKTRDVAAIKSARTLERNVQLRTAATQAAIANAQREAQTVAANAAKETAARRQQLEQQKAADRAADQAARQQQATQAAVQARQTAATATTKTLEQARRQLAAVDAKVAQVQGAEAQAIARRNELERVGVTLAQASKTAAASQDAGLKRAVASRIKANKGRIDEADLERNTARTAAANAATRQKALEAEAAVTARATKLRTQGTAALAKQDALARVASTQVAAAEARLSQIRIASNKFLLAEEAARAGNNKQLLAEIAALRRDTAAKLENAEAAVLAARATASQARAQSQLARGAGASALTFAGLRGATLAASAQFLVGTAAVVALAKALGGAVSLERDLNVFKETTGATADEMERVAEAARALGRDVSLPGISASDAAQAMLELARAGLSVENAIAGSRGVLQLATAAQLDNARATELTASALNAFGLSGESATHVADLFANAANASQGSIEDMGVALQQSAAVARQVGISLEDTNALLTLFARNGLRGSDAGTSLRTALIRLVAPSREANDLIRSLGLSIRDAQGNVRPEVFAEFGQATEGLGPELQDAFAATIFGQDAIRGVAIAAREGVDGLNEMRDSLDREGAAADLAAARTKGLAGQVSALASNLETLGTELGGLALPGLERITEGINTAVVAAERLFGLFREGRGEGPDISGLEQVERVERRIPLIGEAFAENDRQFREFVQGVKDAGPKIDAFVQKLIDPEGAARKQEQAIQELAQTARDFLPDAMESAAFSIENFRAAAQRAAETTPLLRAELSALADAASRVQIGGDPIQQAINQAVATLQQQLQQLREAQKEGAAEATLEPIREAIDASTELLRSFGPRGVQALRQSGAQLAPILADQLREALGSATGVDLERGGISEALRRQITDLAKLGPAGRRELRAIGLLLMSGLREGLDQGGEDAVKSARENLQNVIRQGEEALRQSVRTARGNVESFAQELVTSVDKVIEQMDFNIPTAQRQIIRIGLGVDLRDAQAALRQARAEGLAGDALQPFIDNVNDAEKALKIFGKSGKASIEDLQRALDELQQRQQRRQLVRGVESAQREFDKLKGTFAGLGQIAPGGSPVINQILSDQRALVQDAKDELKTFDLTNLIQGAERIRDKYKEAKEEGVKKLVDEFLRGKKTAKDFEIQLRAQLAPVLEDLPKKNLGMGFTDAFRRQIDTLVKQAQALAGFLGIPGTVGAEIEEPAKAAAKAAQDRLKAAEQLQKAIRDSSKKTEKNTADTVTALKVIAKVFAGRPLTKAEIKAVSTGDPAALRRLERANAPG